MMTEFGVPPFGTYRLKGIRKKLLAIAQHQRPTWLGRRLALIARKLVLHHRDLPIDASTEGLLIRAHVGDNVSERKFLFMPQFTDPQERDFLSAHLTPNGMFIDIGANAGIYTLTAARRYSSLGGKGHVIAVEANPTMQERLNYNVNLNKLENRVHLEPVALDSQDGTATFSISSRNLGESGLASTGEKTIQVPTRTLLSLLSSHPPARVDGIKIDVEGIEDAILTPFLEQAVRAQLPNFIIIEDSTSRWRSDLPGLLASKGYKVRMRCKMNLVLVLQQAGDA